MEHLKDCEKEEMKMLDAEEKDFKERQQKLEKIKREVSPHGESIHLMYLLENRGSINHGALS